MGITITEALAETKLIGKKVEKKQAFIRSYIARQKIVVDPFTKEGGSEKKIDGEAQAINDLLVRLVKIRKGIAAANLATYVTIEGMTLTVTEWLAWRREVAGIQLAHEKGVTAQIERVRNEAAKSHATAESDMQRAQWDVVICLDESELHRKIERTQEILDRLDGKLSLVNATTEIDL
jgi:hypothetical protein